MKVDMVDGDNLPNMNKRSECLIQPSALKCRDPVGEKVASWRIDFFMSK